MAAGLCGGVLAGRPLQTAMHETPAMRRAVGRLLAERRHDLVHVQLARMAGCVEETALLPRVIDLVDALSLNFQRRSGYDRAPFEIAARLEARRLQRYEREICHTWDHATVVSPVDRGAIGDFANLTVNRSGVSLAIAAGAPAKVIRIRSFSPATSATSPTPTRFAGLFARSFRSSRARSRGQDCWWSVHGRGTRYARSPRAIGGSQSKASSDGCRLTSSAADWRSRRCAPARDRSSR
jgi:hypothetical protein